MSPQRSNYVIFPCLKRGLISANGISRNVKFNLSLLVFVEVSEGRLLRFICCPHKHGHFSSLPNLLTIYSFGWYWFKYPVFSHASLVDMNYLLIISSKTQNRLWLIYLRSSHRWCSIKKIFSKSSQISQENTCAWISFLVKLQASAFNFIKKETLAQVFSCEFCEILKDIFFVEHIRVTTSYLACI